MKSRHQQQAIWGVVIWVIMFIWFMVMLFSVQFKSTWASGIKGDTATLLFGINLGLQYLSYFWASNHLSKAKGYSNIFVVIGIFGPVAQLGLLSVLLVLPDKFPKPSNRPPSSRTKRKHVSIEVRIARYRRNAFRGIVFGMLSVFFSLFFTVYAALFPDPEIGTVIGLSLFVVAYICVISGGVWWAKAKCWSEGVVLIGLAPLLVLLIPGVRLIYVVIPELLPVSMVMMPITLIAIVMVLPDKSGIPKTRLLDLSRIGTSQSKED